MGCRVSCRSPQYEKNPRQQREAAEACFRRVRSPASLTRGCVSPLSIPHHRRIPPGPGPPTDTEPSAPLVTPLGPPTLIEPSAPLVTPFGPPTLMLPRPGGEGGLGGVGPPGVEGEPGVPGEPLFPPGLPELLPPPLGGPPLASLRGELPVDGAVGDWPGARWHWAGVLTRCSRSVRQAASSNSTLGAGVIQPARINRNRRRSVLIALLLFGGFGAQFSGVDPRLSQHPALIRRELHLLRVRAPA